MNTFKYAIIVAASAVFLFACGQNAPVNTNGNAASSPAGPPVDTLVAGRKLYNQNCAACHRTNGKGGAMDFDGKAINPEDLTGEKIVRSTDEKLYEYIFNGIPDEGMPAFKEKLKEPQIREVVRYIRGELQAKQRQ